MSASFFSLLFDPGEFTCAGGTKAWRVRPIEEVAKDTDSPLFCTNPLDPLRDLNPTEDWHREDLPRRADANVTRLGNILIECDEGLSLKEQPGYVRSIGLPYSAVVYSGGKSNHYHLCVIEPFASLAERRDFVDRLYIGFGRAQADPQCKNASRLSRFPGHLRDGVTEQRLLEVRERIGRETLERWLDERGVPKVLPKPARIKVERGPGLVPRFSSRTRNLLMVGPPPGLTGGAIRNAIRAAMFEMRDSGIDIERAITLLAAAPGVLDAERGEAELLRHLEWVYSLEEVVS